jgi:hypothetical protein
MLGDLSTGQATIAAITLGEYQRKAPCPCMLTSFASMQLEPDSRHLGIHKD